MEIALGYEDPIIPEEKVYKVKRSCGCRSRTDLTTNLWIETETCLECGWTIHKEIVKE